MASIPALISGYHPLRLKTVDTRTRRSMRSGCWIAARRPTAPPNEKPMIAALSSPRLRIRAAISSDRKSTRLNSSHVAISYAVFCLKKKKPRPDTHVDCLTRHPRYYFVRFAHQVAEIDHRPPDYVTHSVIQPPLVQRDHDDLLLSLY